MPTSIKWYNYHSELTLKIVNNKIGMKFYAMDKE